MKITITILTLAVSSFMAFAQFEQYVTITLTADSGGLSTYTINQNQAAELMSCKALQGGCILVVSTAGCTVTNNIPLQNQNQFTAADTASGGRGTIIQGPAAFSLLSYSSTRSFLTLKIIPESYDPNKTFIIPPGTNQVQVTLQVSTNLINWDTATNGVYGSPATAQFFRIREDNLVSP
jgi:hypothetical protein